MSPLLNIIFGLIVGILFYRLILIDIVQSSRYHGPNSNEIIKNIYQQNDKYFKFIPKICPCPI